MPHRRDDRRQVRQRTLGRASESHRIAQWSEELARDGQIGRSHRVVRSRLQYRRSTLTARDVMREIVNELGLS